MPKNIRQKNWEKVCSNNRFLNLNILNYFLENITQTTKLKLNQALFDKT